MKNTFVSLLLLLNAWFASGQVNYLHKTFEPLNSVIANPERGFFHFTSVRSSKSYNQLEAEKLMAYRNEGVTLIFRNFILDGHVSAYLPSSFLKGMEDDFALLRQYGLKAVIRFCYTEKSTPPYGDASLDWMLKHIQQLEPVLRQNSDVILVVQAGFIGAWGEWYYTDHFASSPGVITPQHWEMRRQLVYALLDALPEYRQVELRTPVYKWKILENDTTPVTVEIAYTGIAKARLGHHNDCFLASPDDVGTYQDIPKEKSYLARDSRFTMVTGETCGVCSPCSDCPNTLAEMARFHWTAINLDYHPSVISGWKAQGCFETIEKNLGYRYRLLSSSIQEQAKPGGSIHLKLRLINEGYSNPVNPRNAYFVLRNTTTGQMYRVAVPGDLRLWPLNDTIKLDLTAGLPAQMPTGNYEVLFHLPDYDISLRDNPFFAIRTANTNTWEPSTGFNSLLTTITVSNNAALPAFSGGVFFSATSSNIPSDLKFKTDGTPLEWDSLSPLYASASPHTQLKYFFDGDTLFLYLAASQTLSTIQVFLDADNSAATGYNSWPWATNGTDIFFENGQLYAHQGAANEWNWLPLGTVPMSVNDTLAEIAIPASLVGVSQGQDIEMAALINNSLPVPEASAPFLRTRLQWNSLHEVRSIAGPGQVVLYWQGTSDDNVSTVVERAEENGAFTRLAVLPSQNVSFTDKNLDSTQAYRYAVYRISSDNYSQKRTTSLVQPNVPADEFISMHCDGLDSDWIVIAPQATTILAGHTVALTMVNYLDSLFVSLRGFSAPSHLKLYFDSDFNAATGLANPLTQQAGCDFMISGDSLFSVQGSAWVFQKKIRVKIKEGFLEWAALLADLQLNSIPSAKFSGILNHKYRIPGHASFAWFYKFTQPGTPAYFKVKNSQASPYSKIILEWNTRNDAQGYIIERSVDDLEHFTRIARLVPTVSYFHDNDVDTSHYYYYRIFAYNGQQRSDYSATLGGRPGQIAEGLPEPIKLTARLSFVPNPAENEIQVKLECTPPAEQAGLQLLNSRGHLVKEVTLGRVSGKAEQRLHLADLPQGVYFLRFVAANYSPSTLRLIIVK